MMDKGYITCWGDSLTAQGGWTEVLSRLSGLPCYNGGTGGENSKTICTRQGADVMIVNDLVIPSKCESVIVAGRKTHGGIMTSEKNFVLPLLQKGAHVNPCRIGNIVGQLLWTGESYDDND